MFYVTSFTSMGSTVYGVDLAVACQLLQEYNSQHAVAATTGGPQVLGGLWCLGMDIHTCPFHNCNETFPMSYVNLDFGVHWAFQAQEESGIFMTTPQPFTPSASRMRSLTSHACEVICFIEPSSWVHKDVSRQQG